MRIVSLICSCMAMLLIVACGCSPAGADCRGPSPTRGRLVIYAAASLAPVMRQLGREFTATTGQELSFSFSSSGTIARQIQAGAPCDVVVSASPAWIDYLSGLALVDPRSVTRFAGNTLVLVAPRGSDLNFAFSGDQDLAGAFGGYMAVGDFESVPVGTYAKQALIELGQLDSLQGRLVSGADAGKVLFYVATGEAAAGIVYATDALRSTRIVTVDALPPNCHSPVTYWAARVSRSRGEEVACKFIDFLVGDRARKALESQGFKTEFARAGEEENCPWRESTGH